MVRRYKIRTEKKEQLSLLEKIACRKKLRQLRLLICEHSKILLQAIAGADIPAHPNGYEMLSKIAEEEKDVNIID